MNNKYLFLDTKDETLTWDDFVSSVEGSHHEQTSTWAQVRESDGWQSKRIVLKNGNGIDAGVQILIRNVAFLGRIGYVSHGPCIKDHSEKYTRKIFESIRIFVKKEQIRYMVVNLPYFGDYMLPIIKKYGYRNAIEGLPPKGLMDSTLLIDLSKSNEEILMEMKKKTRYNIGKGIRSGIEVRQGGKEDIQLFFSLMITTCKRRNSPPTHPEVDFFIRLWDKFEKNDWIRIDVAEYKGKPLCAILSFTFGDTFRIWKFGWSGEHKELHSSTVLTWKLIELAKEKGYRYFDFVMLDKEVAEKIKNNHPITEKLKSKGFYGPTVYKLSFGGIVTHLPGAYALFPNMMLRLMFQSIGVLLKQRWIMRTVNAMWKKILKNQR